MADKEISVLHDVVFESDNHGKEMLSGLNNLRREQQLFDVKLSVAGQIFAAHRVVLASCSPYFRAMFTGNMREKEQSVIDLNGISIAGLEQLLEYAYTSKVVLNLANIQNVLAAANHLQILPVVKACSNYLQEELDLDNCVDIATIADTYCLYTLKKKAYCYMAERLPQLSCMHSFQRLSSTQLAHLLCNDYPIQCPELDVLLAVLIWVHHDTLAREVHLPELVSCIHFFDISEEDMTYLQQSAVYTDLDNKITNLKALLAGTNSVKQQTPSPVVGLINRRGLEEVIVNVGGFRSYTGVTNSLSYLHPKSGEWRELTSIPHVPQCNYGVAVLNNDLYVFGGCYNNVLLDAVHNCGFKYSPRSNTWEFLTQMKHERTGFYLTACQGKLFAIAGLDVNGVEDNSPCESYNPKTSSWSLISPIPMSINRKQFSGATTSNQIFISGGIDLDEIFDSMFCYNVLDDSWRSLPNMMTPRVDHNMITYEGKVHVAGGWYEDSNLSRVFVHSVDIFDAATSQWTVLTHLPTPRYLSSMVVHEGKLVVIGGFEEGGFRTSSSKVEVYHKGEWTSLPAYPTDLWEHLSCVLYLPMCRDDPTVVPADESTC